MRLGSLFAGGKTKRDGGYDFPAAAFAYVPDPNTPSTWKVRLWETPTTKETAAQVGRAAAALSAGGFRGNPAEIPAKDLAAVRRKVRAAWKRQNPDKADADMPAGIRMSAEFSVEEDGWVHKYGKLFEVGEWPDKRFSLNPDELAAAVAAFEPVAVDIEHRPSLLDGKLGTLEYVEPTDDGTELYGTWAMPRWLDTVLEDAENTISLQWTPPGEPKRIKGMALVRNPRIDDAVLMGAFSADALANLPPAPPTFSELSQAVREGRFDAVLAALLAEEDLVERGHLFQFAASTRHDTSSGRSTLQQIHDTTARYGAVCKGGGAQMASQHEASAVQQIHDVAAEHGAECEDMAKSRSPMWFSGPPIIAPAAPAGGNMGLEDMLRRIGWTPPAEGGDGGAAGDGAPAPTSATSGTGGSTPATSAAPAGDPAFAANQAEMTRLREENSRLRLSRIQQEAVTFADDKIRHGQMFKAEREAFITAYVQAALDDEAVPVTFSADGKPGASRVEMLTKAVQARPEKQLDAEQLTDQVLSSLQSFSTGAKKPGDDTSPETIEKMLATTPRGQALLAERAAAKNGR